jgi:hypothetical protein
MTGELECSAPQTGTPNPQVPMTLLLSMLLACEPSVLALGSVAVPVEAEHAEPRPSMRLVTASTVEVLAHVRALDDEQRLLAAASMRTLTVNCPYSRAAVQLPWVAHRVVSGIDAQHLDPSVRADWVTLQEGLSAHVDILEALKIDLAIPETGDYLYSQADTPVVVTRAELLAHADPVAATWPLLKATPALVEAYSPATRAIIDQQSVQLQDLGVNPWDLAVHAEGWLDTLVRVEPFVSAADERATVRELVEALTIFQDQGC